MFVAKGVNVFPSSIQKLLLAKQPKVTGEFYIVLNQPPPIDYPPLIRVEVGHGQASSIYQEIVGEIEQTLREQLGLKAEIELVPAGTIASEHKTRRLYRVYRGDTAPS